MSVNSLELWNQPPESVPTAVPAEGSPDLPDLRSARILIVDDEPTTVEVVKAYLESAGYGSVRGTIDSRSAVARIRRELPDLILLDLMMPEVNGFDILEALQREESRFRIPTIVLTSVTDLASKHRALGLGAVDFLGKPVEPTELSLRVRNHVATKVYGDKLREEQAHSERLLASMLPGAIRSRLRSGEHLIADRFDSATVLFADLVNFTELAATMDPAAVVDLLNVVFERFDHIASEHRLEKIKTVGDAYMLAGGVPVPRADHASAVVEAGLAMLEELAGVDPVAGRKLALRVGVHTGPVVAGIIGRHRMSYDLWGDTVNVASRMESTGVPGVIQVSDAVLAQLDRHYRVKPRSAVCVKGKGVMTTYLIGASSSGEEDTILSRRALGLG